MSSIRSILEEVAYKHSVEEFTNPSDDAYNVGILTEVIDQALKDISEAIDGSKPSYIFDDGNNDATWAYKKGVTEYQSNLKELLK